MSRYDIGKLELFPTQPGVYVMKDHTKSVLYVGKAKNLKQRVKQYFVRGGDGRSMVPFLIEKVADIDIQVVRSEKEALLLENTLIKEHRPPYNAILKDDKTFISLKVTVQHPWPMVQLVRYKGRPPKDGLYFGPYTSAIAARQTLDLINRVFPLRQCSDQELARRDRPCILYQMKRCVAPCVHLCSKEEYDGHVKNTVKFLKGQDREVLKELYQEMNQASEDMAFEKAADILRLIRQIEGTIEPQYVHRETAIHTDVWGLYRQAEEGVVSLLPYRFGRLMGIQTFSFSGIAQDDEELLHSFLLQYYEQVSEVPHEVVLPLALSDPEAIEEILGSQSQHKVAILLPCRGDKVKWVDMANTNAEAAFKKEKDVRTIREKTLLEMKEKLHLMRYPRRIECFDNSHLAGSEPVSALVTFTDGEKDTKGYRKYCLKVAAASDDYGAMREVLVRRYQKAKEENHLPDLLIVDGGKGQLNVARQVFAELNIISVDLIGLAKEEGRHDKGMTLEKIFLSDIKEPLALKKTSSILYLLQQIRDEAHRFVIAFHRKRRSKDVIKSELEEIPGIGPKKQQLLLKRFGSVKKIFTASEEELKTSKGLSRRDIQSLMEWRRKN